MSATCRSILTGQHRWVRDATGAGCVCVNCGEMISFAELPLTTDGRPWLCAHCGEPKRAHFEVAGVLVCRRSAFEPGAPEPERCRCGVLRSVSHYCSAVEHSWTPGRDRRGAQNF